MQSGKDKDKRKLTDHIWEHAARSADKKSFTCNYCQLTFVGSYKKAQEHLLGSDTSSVAALPLCDKVPSDVASSLRSRKRKANPDNALILSAKRKLVPESALVRAGEGGVPQLLLTFMACNSMPLSAEAIDVSSLRCLISKIAEFGPSAADFLNRPDWFDRSLQEFREHVSRHMSMVKDTWKETGVALMLFTIKNRIVPALYSPAGFLFLDVKLEASDVSNNSKIAEALFSHFLNVDMKSEITRFIVHEHGIDSGCLYREAELQIGSHSFDASDVAATHNRTTAGTSRIIQLSTSSDDAASSKHSTAVAAATLNPPTAGTIPIIQVQQPVSSYDAVTSHPSTAARSPSTALAPNTDCSYAAIPSGSSIRNTNDVLDDFVHSYPTPTQSEESEEEEGEGEEEEGEGEEEEGEGKEEEGEGGGEGKDSDSFAKKLEEQLSVDIESQFKCFHLRVQVFCEFLYLDCPKVTAIIDKCELIYEFITESGFLPREIGKDLPARVGKVGGHMICARAIVNLGMKLQKWHFGLSDDEKSSFVRDKEDTFSIITDRQFWLDANGLFRGLNQVFLSSSAMDSLFPAAGYLEEVLDKIEESLVNSQRYNPAIFETVVQNFKLWRSDIATSGYSNQSYACYFCPSFVQKWGLSNMELTEASILKLMHYENPLEVDALKVEIHAYTSIEGNPFTVLTSSEIQSSHPLSLWKQFGDGFPLLKKAAFKVLSQPVCCLSYQVSKMVSKLKLEADDDFVLRLNVMMIEEFRRMGSSYQNINM